MACTYTLTQDDCFLIITESPSGKTTQQINLSTLVWETKSGNVISIKDGDDNDFTANITQIPAFADIPTLVAQLDTWRDACSLVPSGGGTPTPVNGTGAYSRTLAVGIASVASGFQSVLFANIGTTTVQIKGVDFIPGQTERIEAYLDPVTGVWKLTPAIDYNATGGFLAISTYL